MVTFSACILLFLSILQLLCCPPQSSHCPGLWSEEGAWVGKGRHQGGMEAVKLAGAPRDGTISTLELMRNPSFPCVIWPPLSSEQPLPIPVFGGINETMVDLQRRRMDLGNSS